MAQISFGIWRVQKCSNDMRVCICWDLDYKYLEPIIRSSKHLGDVRPIARPLLSSTLSL